MAIPLIFPPEVLAGDVHDWALAHGLRLVGDGRGNLRAVPLCEVRRGKR